MKPLLLLPLLPMLLVILLILLTLPSCTTIAVHSDGSCDVETVRKTTVQCGDSVIATGEVILNQESVRKIADEVGEVVK